MTEQEMLLGAVSCLVGCIGYLHKRLSDSFDRTTRRLSDKLDECESKHHEANTKILELAETVGKLLGYKELHDNIIDKIDKMRK
jgi:hypothetical protein